MCKINIHIHLLNKNKVLYLVTSCKRRDRQDKVSKLGDAKVKSQQKEEGGDMKVRGGRDKRLTC